MFKTRLIFSMVTGFMLTMGMITTVDAKQGFYLGVGGGYNTISGDFSGNSGIGNDSEIIILPDIDAAVGLGILIGYGVDEKWAFEVSFLSSAHDGTWGGMTGDVDYTGLCLNAKYNFSSEATQPYLMFGISSDNLVIREGSQSSTGHVGDGKLFGSGFNIGAGIEHFFDHFSMRFGFSYRLVSYDQAEGVQGERATIEDGIDGNGSGFMLSTAYHF